jgi:hypothetical protein
MRKIVSVMGVIFMALCICLVANQGLAASKNKAKKPAARKAAKTISVKGDIVKQLNAKGKLLGVQLKAEDGKIYKVALNKNGIRLGKQLHGKKAEVFAGLVKRGTKKKPVFWLRVKSFKEMPTAQPESEEEGEDDSSEQDEE